MQTRQHHGIWEKDFKYDDSEGIFKLCVEECLVEHGVLTVALKRLATLVTSGYQDAHQLYIYIYVLNLISATCVGVCVCVGDLNCYRQAQDTDVCNSRI